MTAGLRTGRAGVAGGMVMAGLRTGMVGVMMLVMSGVGTGWLGVRAGMLVLRPGVIRESPAMFMLAMLAASAAGSGTGIPAITAGSSTGATAGTAATGAAGANGDTATGAGTGAVVSGELAMTWVGVSVMPVSGVRVDTGAAGD